ncbi:MAG: 4Fe-4S binding protein [Acidobacteriota bacterium]|nr:4Fe-4S binding protein [Acidobacteriota bacterium]
MPKKLARRAPPDRSQALRRAFQFSFLALNVWIGAQFFVFVRYYERGGTTMAAQRPAGVEGWLPIASLMNLKVLALTGELPRVHPAGTLLLAAFLAASWIFRKSFCSWLCPIGTISEYLARLGRSVFRRNFHPPRWLDIGLRGIKYLLLAFFLSIVATMPVIAIRQFLGGPYGVVDDVLMLNFFREMELPGAIVMVILILGSVLVQNLWCRYLCPYGALMGLLSFASPLRIRRDTNACIDCAKCAKACPSALPVDQLITIRSIECTGCLQCVASCPAEGALVLSAPARRRVPAWAVAAGVFTLFFGAYLYGVSTGHWNTNLPESVYYRLIPNAGEFSH